VNIVWTSIAWKQYVEMQAQDKKVIKTGTMKKSWV